MVHDRIIRLRRNFLWNSKHPLVSWDECCLRNRKVDLVLETYRLVIRHFLSKCLWDIHLKNDTLWVRWVNHMYLHSQSTWQWVAQNGLSFIEATYHCLGHNLPPIRHRRGCDINTCYLGRWKQDQCRVGI